MRHWMGWGAGHRTLGHTGIWPARRRTGRRSRAPAYKLAAGAMEAGKTLAPEPACFSTASGFASLPQQGR